MNSGSTSWGLDTRCILCDIVDLYWEDFIIWIIAVRLNLQSCDPNQESRILSKMEPSSSQQHTENKDANCRFRHGLNRHCFTEIFQYFNSVDFYIIVWMCTTTFTDVYSKIAWIIWPPWFFFGQVPQNCFVCSQFIDTDMYLKHHEFPNQFTESSKCHWMRIF